MKIALISFSDLKVSKIRQDWEIFSAVRYFSGHVPAAIADDIRASSLTYILLLLLYRTASGYKPANRLADDAELF